MRAMFVLIDGITQIYLEQTFYVFTKTCKHGGSKLDTEIVDGA